MATNGAHSSKCLAILGCGIMGSALVKGWLRLHDGTTYRLYTKTDASQTRLRSELGDHQSDIKYFSADQIVETVQGADVVLLGFLPKDLGKVAAASGLAQAISQKLVVSLLAGVSTMTIHDALLSQAKGEWHIARVIPTMAAPVGQSATLVAVNEQLSAQTLDETIALFSSVGSTVKIPEHLMDEATAIGAAIHALAIVAIDAATDAGVTQGMERSMAAELIVQSLQSAIASMSIGGKTPADMKKDMSTPGGITINAIASLDASARPGISQAVISAVKHTKAMS